MELDILILASLLISKLIERSALSSSSSDSPPGGVGVVSISLGVEELIDLVFVGLDHDAFITRSLHIT